MSINKILDSITREHILKAASKLDQGIEHDFGDSTGYDLIINGRKYPPKAVVGLAAFESRGTVLKPSDFKGGMNSKCFKVLQSNGFTIVSKGDTHPFPDEVECIETLSEGAVQKIFVNRYERDANARARAILHHGCTCKVCGFDFQRTYGVVGEGFIHVHHIIPLSKIGKTYLVNPATDLVPVCPNCHAMLHKRTPPYSIEELQMILKTVVAS